MGVANAPANIAVEAINITTDTSRYNRYLDRKHYELGNHLGNVLATVSGHKVMMQETVRQWAFGFEPGKDNIFDDDRHEQLLSTTQAHTGTYSIYQDYSAGGEWGPGKHIHVHAGDILNASLYGYTENATPSQSGAFIKTLVDASGTLLYLPSGTPAWESQGLFTYQTWTQRGFTNYTIPNTLYDALGNPVDMDEVYLFMYTWIPSGEGPTYFDDIFITIQWADPVNYYQADVVSYSDYYPFGMQMPGRNGSSGEYRYGFNGMEKDDEVKGSGNSLDFGARIYDSRIGRWLSVDPIIERYPGLSPYHFVSNNPMAKIDPDGRTDYYFHGKFIRSDGVDNGIVGIVTERKVKRQIKKGALIQGPGLRNGEKFDGGYFVHSEVLGAVKKISDLAFTRGTDREFSVALEGQDQYDLPPLSGPFVRSSKQHFRRSAIHEGPRINLNSPLTNNVTGARVGIPDGDVSIHSHPTGYGKVSVSTEPSWIKDFGENSDEATFRKYEMNIIVGNSSITTLNYSTTATGQTVLNKADQGQQVVDIYGDGATKDKMIGRLKRNELDNIVGDQKEKGKIP